MSGLFVNPGVRFLLRFRFLRSADRRCLRLGSRIYEAEFPLARLIVYRFLLLFRSREISVSPTKDRAPTKIGALRPFNNWVKPEDQYGISFIGEKRPAFARRLPQKGRQSPAPPECAFARTGEEIAPAADHGPFHRRRETGGETGAGTSSSRQWFATTAGPTAFA